MRTCVPVGRRLPFVAHVQRGSVLRRVDVPRRSSGQRLGPARELQHEQRLPRGQLLREPRRRLALLWMPDLQHVHCLRRLGLRGLRVEQPVHRRPGLRVRLVRRVHLERSMRGGPGLRRGPLRRLRDGRPMRSHRALFGDALDHSLHVLPQRRLRPRRRLRLRHLHAGLRLERRLRAGPSLRGRGVRRVHHERTVRLERDRGMPIGDVFLFLAGGLRDGSGLRFGQLRRVPVQLGLRRAGLHRWDLQRLFDVRRLQPDNLRWGSGSCVRERRMRRMHLQQPVRRR